MPRTVLCAKLKKELPGLEFLPFKSPLGEKIYHEISEEAWGEWVKHSTMVINEFRLNPSTPDAQKVLMEQMEKFLFSDGSDVAPPPDFVPLEPASEEETKE
ncbi:MAG: oxidative damage protection protein [Myxococcota bacterium]|nr:oxidative damage protection protein [Myxococcota bacterium]